MFLPQLADGRIGVVDTAVLKTKRHAPVPRHRCAAPPSGFLLSWESGAGQSSRKDPAPSLCESDPRRGNMEKEPRQERPHPDAASGRCQGSPGTGKSARHWSGQRTSGSSPSRRTPNGCQWPQRRSSARPAPGPGKSSPMTGATAGSASVHRGRRYGRDAMSLRAAPDSRIDGLGRPVVVSGSRFRPPDSDPISCLTTLETAILVPLSTVSPPDCR